MEIDFASPYSEPQPTWEDWAEEIKSLFPKHDGGWTISQQEILRLHQLFGYEGNGYLEDSYSGGVLQFHDPLNPTVDDKALMTAFRAAGIPYTIATEKGDAGSGENDDIIGISFGIKKIH